MNDECIVQAVSRGVTKTMADGTVRFSIEVEPDDALRAFEAFGMPGIPVAVVRLTDGAELAAMQKQTAEKPRGGKLSRDAAMLCHDEKFHKFAWETWRGTKEGQQDYLAWEIGELHATYFLRKWCKVESRAELDHDEKAAALFRALHKRYSEWVEKWTSATSP